MATRNILQLGDPALRKQSRPVTEFDSKLGVLLDDMTETLRQAAGAGLAAPQVGVLKRVVVVCDEGNYIELVNPVVQRESGIQENVEGCLSIPGKYGITKRPRKVAVKAFDRHGKAFRITGENLLARCLCHEIDHLNGILFIDHVERMLSAEELKKIRSK